MSKGELAKHKSCVLCNQHVQEEQVQANGAMKEKELEAVRIEQHERSIALEKQRKEDMIEQWKNQVTHVLTNKPDCDSLRRLLTTKPLYGDLEEKCELIQKQLALCEIEEEKIIEQEAQKIVAQKKVYLDANYMKHAEELQRYGAQWYGGNSWSVPIKNISSCAPWLKHSEKLIPRVQALQKEEKVTYASNKRKNPPPIEPVAKKQRITSFFLKK